MISVTSDIWVEILIQFKFGMMWEVASPVDWQWNDRSYGACGTTLPQFSFGSHLLFEDLSLNIYVGWLEKNYCTDNSQKVIT